MSVFFVFTTMQGEKKKMKKLIALSFAFAIASMLCTSVFANTLDIYSYEGNEGLVERTDPISKGDVLNIKTTYIRQTQDNYKNNILSKGIIINGDGEVSGTAAVTNGAFVTVDGGQYDGFYMDSSATSTMNNLGLTNYAGTIIGIYGEQGEDIKAELTLKDVDLYVNASASGDSAASVYIEGKNSKLNIVSENRDVKIHDNNWFGFEYGSTVNFKGNKIDLSNDVRADESTINNSSNLTYKGEMRLEGKTVMNNTGEFSNAAGYIRVYDDSVINNKGYFSNVNGSTVCLGGCLEYIRPNNFMLKAESNALNLIDMGMSNGQDYIIHSPVFNNDEELYNEGRIIVGEYAIFNNNADIYNYGNIEVYDGGKFNNKGYIEQDADQTYGEINVYGEFDNKSGAEIVSNTKIYVGKQNQYSNDNENVAAGQLISEDYDLSDWYAIFDNNGKIYSKGEKSNITVDTDGIFNNNKTIVSDGQITIYGQFNNKGTIDGAYIYLDTNYTGSSSRKTIAKASTPRMVDFAEYRVPVLRNYNRIDVSEGFYGTGTIYNNGTINLGGEVNPAFSGTVLVDHGTINLMKDSYFLNGCVQHIYSEGTLNLINETLDYVYMDQLYLEGDMYLKMDIDLAGPSPEQQNRGDYLYVNYCQSGSRPYNPERSVANSQIVYDDIDYHQILINSLDIWSDSEKDITSVIIANEIPQEAIHLAGSQRLVYGPMYGYKVTISTTVYESPDSGIQIEEPVNVVYNYNAQELTTGENEEEEIVVEGMDYGNVLTFQKLKDHYSPEIEQSKVAIAGANISQEEIFDTVLNNAGNFSFFQKQGTSAGDVEDSSAPTLWIKGFGSKEDVDLEDYVTVKTTYYGAMIGVDWERQYSETFDATYGIFGSYIGGELKNDDYTNSKVTQNGAYLGVRANWYFGELSKFFVNGIIDYGFINNNSETRTETNDFNSQVIGLAARAGYNFEWANKSFTVQPSFGITGKYIITDDIEAKLTDESSIKEEIGNITNITYEPGLKLIKNLGRCWILTREGKYVIEQVDGEVKVEEQVLPDTSYENYTDLGLGVEKIWGYTVLHLKANKTFGGRDGFGINAGIEFKF